MPIFATILWLVAGHAAAGPIDFVAYGDLRGYLEPCGCEPETDLGGLKRLASAISTKRLASEKLYVFDLGNHGEKSDKKNGDKLPYVRSAVKLIKPDAVLFNRHELEDFADAVATKLPFVLSNYLKPLTSPSMSLTTGDLTIFGFVSPKPKEQFLHGAEKTAAWVSGWTKKPGNYVLLFSGTDKDLEHFMKVPNLEIISDANLPMDYIPMGKERAEPGKLLRATSKSKDVYSIPVAGQGLLLGGRAGQTISSPLNGSGSPCLGKSCSSPPPFAIGGGKEIFFWLDHTVKDKGELSAVFAVYKHSTDKKFAEVEERRKGDLASSKFAGNATCVGCHAAESKIWQESRHAGAIATLKKVGKDRDPECVTCHVVGYTEKGGYVSEEASPHLANVQCETCHGPRREHVESGGKITVASDAKAVCTTCHHPPHSAAFNYLEYWSKIAHGTKKK